MCDTPYNTSPIGIRFAKSIEKQLKNARFQEYHQKKRSKRIFHYFTPGAFYRKMLDIFK